MVIFEISNIFAENISEMSKIIGIGNALVDVLAPISDESVLKEMGLTKGAMQLVDQQQYTRISQHMAAMQTTCTTGGSAANSMKVLAHLGAQPGFVGQVGNDAYGQFFINHFQQIGIRTHIKTAADHLPTGVASTFITPDGQRTFGTHLGAAALMGAEDIRPELFDGYSYLYLEGYLVQNHEMIEQAMRTAKAAGLMVAIDLASFNIVAAERDFFTHLLQHYVDIVFANEEEAEAFVEGTAEQALDTLGQLCHIAVVKQGKKGAAVRRGDETVSTQAMQVPAVIDTTAAGDYFAGGFLYALSRHHSLQACADAGSLCSGYIIQTIGTVLPEETWQTLRRQLALICEA